MQHTRLTIEKEYDSPIYSKTGAKIRESDKSSKHARSNASTRPKLLLDS